MSEKLQQKLQEMSMELVDAVYAVLGITRPKDRMLNQTVIILEAGKPVVVQEKTFPIETIKSDA